MNGKQLQQAGGILQHFFFYSTQTWNNLQTGERNRWAENLKASLQRKSFENDSQWTLNINETKITIQIRKGTTRVLFEIIEQIVDI